MRRTGRAAPPESALQAGGSGRRRERPPHLRPLANSRRALPAGRSGSSPGPTRPDARSPAGPSLRRDHGRRRPRSRAGHPKAGATPPSAATPTRGGSREYAAPCRAAYPARHVQPSRTRRAAAFARLHVPCGVRRPAGCGVLPAPAAGGRRRARRRGVGLRVSGPDRGRRRPWSRRRLGPAGLRASGLGPGLLPLRAAGSARRELAKGRRCGGRSRRLPLPPAGRLNWRRRRVAAPDGAGRPGPPNCSRRTPCSPLRGGSAVGARTNRLTPGGERPRRGLAVAAGGCRWGRAGNCGARPRE